MPRSPFLPQGYDESSSLDPLADALDTYKSPAATRRLSSPIRSPTRQGSPTSHNNISIIANSTTRTVTEKILSPWKVKVTVEAEPEDIDTAATMTSQATTVPLRTTSSPLPTANGADTARARSPRPSLPKTKGRRTPVRGNSRSHNRSRRHSVTNLDLVVLGDDADSDEWTARKQSPKKKKQASGRARRSTSVASETTLDDQAVFEIHNDQDEGIAVDEEPAFRTSETPELRQIDLNRVSVRPRMQSTNQKDNWSKHTQHSARKVSANSAMSYPTPSPTSSYHGDSDGTDKPTNHPDDLDTIMESEGFTMIDLDSIPSVRQFLSTPVDPSEEHQPNPAVVGDHKVVQNAQAPYQYTAAVDEETELSSTVPSSPPITDNCHDSSLLQIPQSAPIGLRKVTPPQDQYSSPRLPSPPRHFRSSQQGHQRTISKEAVQAGKVLQGLVLHPRNDTPQPDRSLSQNTASTPQGELYEGFSSGTQRELRAGLRFGEELAKRQELSASDPVEPVADHRLSSKPRFTALTRPAAATQIWRGEAPVRHTSPLAPNPLAQINNPPKEHSKTQLTETHQLQSKLGIETPKTYNQKGESEPLDTEARWERKWQLEREAVSREIENASQSKVMVISDDEEDHQPGPGSCAGSKIAHYTGALTETLGQEDDGGDIWLEEAKEGSSSPGEDLPVDQKGRLFTGSEQRRQGERAAEVINKPRRNLLPSPWKRGEDIDASVFLSHGDNSGIFWQDPQDGVFGAGDIAQAEKRLKSGSAFDLVKMLSSPVKFAELGKGNLRLTIDRDDRQQDDERDDIATVLDSEHSHLHSSLSLSSSLTQRIRVNFNDSTLSQDITPPRVTCLSPSPVQCPPTPRSAMKGARVSAEPAVCVNESPRKVVFNRRSMYLNEYGEESTMSAKLDSTEEETEEMDEADDQQPELEIAEEAESEKTPDIKGGWMSWLWRGNTKPAVSSTAPTSTTTVPYRLDGSAESNPHSNAPLATSGPFTNTHFRTLHIIHAKSLRPRFHAPDTIRPALHRMVEAGWRMDVDVDWQHSSRADVGHLDDSGSSLGEIFTWTLGALEAHVIERFMQECEHSCVLAGYAPDMTQVQWGWSLEDVVRKLGMVAVGEVVRKEEKEKQR
ncbi:hypothetical protein DV736_g2700, partial [Chaetothyriales sp. CBS 134916]